MGIERRHAAPWAEAEVGGSDVLSGDHAHREGILGGGALERGGWNELAADGARAQRYGIPVLAASGFLRLADLRHMQPK